MDEKGLLAEAVRVLASEMGQIRGILDEGLMEMVDVMGQWMEDHQPEVPEEKWHSEDKVEVSSLHLATYSWRNPQES